jgi:putative spermidine/putrescine transport system permease protein
MRWRAAGRAAATALALLVVLPLVVLPVRAFADVWRAPALLPQRWGLRGVEVVLSPGTGTVTAIGNSLLVAVATTGLALLLAWPAARWLATASTRRRTPVLILLALPLLVPPLAIGTGLAEWFLRLGLTTSLAGLVLAHLVAVLPYVVVVLSPGFSPTVRSAEEAARTLGADRWQVLRKVSLPLLAPSLAVASLLGGLVSWSQYGSSLGVGRGIPMLPLVLEPFVGRDPQVAATLALVFLVPAVLALVAATRRTAGRNVRG